MREIMEKTCENSLILNDFNRFCPFSNRRKQIDSMAETVLFWSESAKFYGFYSAFILVKKRFLMLLVQT